MSYIPLFVYSVNYLTITELIRDFSCAKSSMGVKLGQSAIIDL